MLENIIRHTRVLEIVGDMIKVRAKDVALGDLAVVENTDGAVSTAEVAGLDRDIVSLQVYSGGKGISTEAKVRFLGHSQEVVFSQNMLGRIFRGSGETIDGKPDLSGDERIPVGGPTVNPVKLLMP